MTNDKTVTMSRELAEGIAQALSDDPAFHDDPMTADYAWKLKELLATQVVESLSVKLPTKHEISVLVWNEWVKASGIPGVSGFNAAEFATEAVIEKIKEFNQ